MLNEIIAIIIILISAIVYFIFPRGKDSMQTRKHRVSMLPSQAPSQVPSQAPIQSPLTCELIPSGVPIPQKCGGSILPMTISSANISAENMPAENMPAMPIAGMSVDGSRSCLRKTPWVFDRSKYLRKRILRPNDPTETRVRIAKTNKRVSFADKRLERHISGGRIKEFYSQV